jgi:dynein heavy chain
VLVVLQVEQAMELIAKIENISGPQLDIQEFYTRTLAIYSRELDTVRKLYTRQKTEPSLPRNLPPVAGKVTWARQLYQRIERPMKLLKKMPEVLKVC